MAEPWEVEVGGQVYEVEADTPQQAAVLARLMAAREQGTTQAETGAMERSQAIPASANENLSPTELLARTKMAQAKNVPPGAVPAALGLVALPGLVSSALAAPGATAASLGAGYLGSEIGERGGRKLEAYGAPEGTGKALGVAGGLAGGVYGAIKGQGILGDLVRAGAGRGTTWGPILERLAGKQAAGTAAATAKETAEAAAAAEARATQRAEAELALKERALVLKEKTAAEKLALARERSAADEARKAERHQAYIDAMKKRIEGGGAIPRPKAAAKPTTAPPASARATAEDVLPEEYVSVIAEPLPTKAPILPAGQRAMATTGGGKARPGPAPTPEVDLEAVLKKTLEALKAKKAGAESPLRGSRLEVGAQKVGRDVGLTKEEVRLQTGPRLDEALGEASPVLPDVPLKKIIDTMKGLPKTGGFREAYVERATSGKTKWQVENVRRTLEHLGLLAPVGVAAGMAASE